MADTGPSATRQRADLSGQGPRDTKVSFMTLARLSAPRHQATFEASQTGRSRSASFSLPATHRATGTLNRYPSSGRHEAR